MMITPVFRRLTIVHSVHSKSFLIGRDYALQALGHSRLKIRLVALCWKIRWRLFNSNWETAQMTHKKSFDKRSLASIPQAAIKAQMWGFTRDTYVTKARTFPHSKDWAPAELKSRLSCCFNQLACNRSTAHPPTQFSKNKLLKYRLYCYP